MSKQPPKTGTDETLSTGSSSDGETTVTRLGERAHSSQSLAAAGSDALGEFSRHLHIYVRQHIQFADQKAGFLFAFAGTVLAYAFQKDLHVQWLKDPARWGLFGLMAFVSMFSLLVSELLAASVILPRLRSSHRGAVFFRSIAAHNSAEDYAATISSLTAPGLSKELLKHSYDLSKICSAKYSAFTMALWLAVVGIVCGVVALLG